MLWTQSLTDPSISPYNFAGMSFSPTMMPWGGRRMIVKVQNQFLGNVGPCTNNGVCIQQGHEVMCLDSVTGKLQWVRHGVPPGSDIFGDDEITLVAPPPESGGGDALVLRTIDGQLLGKRPVPPVDQRWNTVGRNVVTWRNSTRQQIADLAERSLGAARYLVGNLCARLERRRRGRRQRGLDAAGRQVHHAARFRRRQDRSTKSSKPNRTCKAFT